MTVLRVILWDQLSTNIASLQGIDKNNDVVFFCEVKEECTYVKHHKKKLVFLLSAMRHFAADLTQNGYQVCYIKLTDKDNTQILTSEIARLAKKIKAKKIVITWPSEYRIYAAINKLKKNVEMDVHIFEDARFLISHTEFQRWGANKKSLRMEFFYREMRKKYNILMDKHLPIGGKWNYDPENRHFPKEKITIPAPYQQPIDKITQYNKRLSMIYSAISRMSSEKLASIYSDAQLFLSTLTSEY